jgi:hypothetical protein
MGLPDEFDPASSMGAPLQQQSQSTPLGPQLGAEQYFRSREAPLFEQRSDNAHQQFKAMIQAIMGQSTDTTPASVAQPPQMPQVQFSTPRAPHIGSQIQQQAAQQPMMPAPGLDASIPMQSQQPTSIAQAIANALGGDPNNPNKSNASSPNSNTMTQIENNPNNLPTLY